MKPAISIRNVTKSFGRKDVLKGITLDVLDGQIFGFLGPNGAGKTTTIRLMMDYTRATAGSIELLGLDAHAHSVELKRSIGYLSSELQLHTEWTARTHIGFIAGMKGRGRADELVKLFELDLDTKVGRLSTGNKQKLAIILAFMGDPRLLIMDEPTRGLDPLLQNQFYDLVRQFAADGGTVFFSSHNLGEVQELCDSVAVIKDGEVVATQTMSDMLQLRVYLIRATLGRAIRVADLNHKDIEVVEHDGARVSLKVKGHIDPVMRVLAEHRIVDLEVTHASLEDIFMEYY